LRQAVIVAAELEPAAAELSRALELGEPFRDPGVGEFGLANVVFALDDCFLEVISPTRAGTAAGRYIERHGDSGYMVIFDLEDLAAARERAHASGVRVVWQVDLPDISGTHLHPADIGGAIVSLDRSIPYGSWRWGGPDWRERADAGAATRLHGITIAVEDPRVVAARWGEVLGVTLSDDGQGSPRLALDHGEIRFRGVLEDGLEGLVEIAVEVPPGLRAGTDSLALGGVRVRMLERA
jgi:hypothetical protein